MKKLIITTMVITMATTALFAQKKVTVPKAVQDAFSRKFPTTQHVTWELENGNYEANWGGKSGEDNGALYTPAGQFLEVAKAVPADKLPAPALQYLKAHYKKAAITEAYLVTDANGKITYEAEVSKKDHVFDEQGNYLKTEKE